MNKSMVLAFLDAEIERLQKARELLSSSGGRNGLRAFPRAADARLSRRHMSAAARRKISEAQKKRWALRKRSAKS